MVERVLAKITAKDEDKCEPQDEFGKGRFRSGSDPRDCIKKLQELQEKLEKRHSVIKTDDDITHQVFEVSGSEHKYTVESLKHDMVINENMTLEKASKRLGARCNEIKKARN